MTRDLAPVSPGEMLLEEFLKPLELSQYALARALHVPPRRINEIVHGKPAVTADTDLRLCRFFGLSEGWWLRLQADYDIAQTKERMSEVLNAIEPLPRDREAA
ncbi:MAG: addiction module antidote protein, HigA family [Halochromatium sp.]|nr:addiction module antidote protein, HigA family [Halochromatium sp.]